jgi:hypothetical protein
VRRGREWLAGVVLAGFGILFAAAVLEAGVRWLHLVPDRFWEPDPVLGARLIPGKHGWWTQEDREFLVPVTINHQGLRDVEHQYTKPPGTFRILVLGDSFVEAMHVPLEATFGHVLQQSLQADQPGAPARRIEVIAAGVSGYGTAGETLYFERDGKRYQPDLVLLAFYPGNDVKNNSPTLEDTLRPVYTTDGTLQRVVGDEPKKTPTGWRGWIGRSAAYHYFRQILLVRHPDLARRLVRFGLLRGDAIKSAPQHNGVPVDYGIYAPTLQADWQEAWQHTERDLARLQQDVSTAGARLVIAVLSSRDQVYPQWWQEIVTANPAMRQTTWDLDAPQRHMEAWCTEHAVPCVALAPAFRDAAGRGSEVLHYHHDGHWTVAGHRLAASVLKDFLERHDLVPTR